MFPFQIQFSRTIDKTQKIEDIDSLLQYCENVLKEKGADRISKESNHIKFDNDFFKIISNWNLMAYVDNGFVKLQETAGKSIKITYGITVTRMLLISLIFTVIITISTKELISFLLAFGFLVVFNWGISALRHWRVLNSLTRDIEEILEDNIEKTRYNNGL